MSRLRHWLNCRLLRTAGVLDHPQLPFLKRSESLIDWMVRAGLAKDAQTAAESLIAARGLDAARDQLMNDPVSLSALQNIRASGAEFTSKESG